MQYIIDLILIFLPFPRNLFTFPHSQLKLERMKVEAEGCIVKE
jgi:hypothetical protein